MPNVLQTNIHTVKPTTRNSSGKHYNNERAIISLTSWKARIGTVGKTLFSLYKQCPGFHIVLVLSENEFPQKEAELPDTIMAFVDKNIVEILWVKKNYKAFKKVMFTLDKYKGIPVISADDDCIYTCNYAELLYKEMLKTNAKVIRYTKRAKQITQGPCTLYRLPPALVEEFIKSLTDEQIKNSQDDQVVSEFLVKHKIKITGALDTNRFPFVFHDDTNPLTKGQRKNVCYAQCFIKR